MDGDQIKLKFTPKEAKLFRAWQQQERAKLAEMRVAEREPWESDPDSWKEGAE